MPRTILISSYVSIGGLSNFMLRNKSTDYSAYTFRVRVPSGCVGIRTDTKSLDGSEFIRNQIFDDTTTPVGDGKWHHIAASYSLDATNKKTTLRFYVDYSLKATKEYPGALLDFQKPGAFYLPDDTFLGTIDELRVSEGVLTPSQFLHVRGPLGSILFIR